MEKRKDKIGCIAWVAVALSISSLFVSIYVVYKLFYWGVL